MKKKRIKKKEVIIIYRTEINISQYALNCTVEQHLPPIHMHCTPKLIDRQKGEEIIKVFFMYIEKDFRKMNKHYNLPLGFEY